MRYQQIFQTNTPLLISVIQAKVFSKLINCKDLKLTNNKICRIEIGAFLGLITLLKLYIEFNQLNFLSIGMFEGVPNLNLLDLSAN